MEGGVGLGAGRVGSRLGTAVTTPQPPSLLKPGFHRRARSAAPPATPPAPAADAAVDAAAAEARAWIAAWRRRQASS